MTRVMAQGTFDIVHPGHLHYLRESAALGDELYVVIARDERVRERKDLFMDEESRRAVVEALEVVDAAVLGSRESIFESVAEIGPDVITLGYDQGFDPEDLEGKLDAEGFGGVRVVRIGPYEEGEILSSSDVKGRIRERHGGSAFEHAGDG